MVVGEFFHLFVIQAPKIVAEELKIAGSGLNIEIVEDLKPYKDRKVAILNACHTALVPVAYLSGIELVKDAVCDEDFAEFLHQLLEKEIIPNLDLPVQSLRDYAAAVIKRFKNPYIEHRLLDISLNSMAKFKNRLLPQFLKYCQKNNNVPALISLSLAALICFYRGERDDKTYHVQDDPKYLGLYKRLWSDSVNITPERTERIAKEVLGLEEHWGAKLSDIDGLKEKITKDILSIQTKGMRETLREYLG